MKFLGFLFSYAFEIGLAAMLAYNVYDSYNDNQVSPKMFVLIFGSFIFYISTLQQQMKNERIYATKKELKELKKEN